jgi:hypothetical protein
MVVALALLVVEAAAGPVESYRAAIDLAAAGQEGEAVARLQGALDLIPSEEGGEAGAWRARLATAAALLDMRRHQQLYPSIHAGSSEAAAVRAHLEAHPGPRPGRPWVAAVLGAALPGVGHLWLGRPRDAAAAAVMVWPMLLLTLWAWRRRMGPVTLFFAAITLWLWSGTAFSAYSLARRGDLQAYLAWWQGIWQASGLPGRPW